MVGATSAGHSVLLQQAHVGGGLAGVQELGIEAVEHGDHAVGLGGDAGKALHKVEGSALGGEDAAGMPLDGHEDIALVYRGSVGDKNVDSQTIVHDFEDTLAHLDAAKDTILLGNHLGRVDGVGRNAGEGGMVAVAHVFAQSHFDEFIQIVNVRHNSLIV